MYTLCTVYCIYTCMYCIYVSSCTYVHTYVHTVSLLFHITTVTVSRRVWDVLRLCLAATKSVQVYSITHHIVYIHTYIHIMCTYVRMYCEYICIYAISICISNICTCTLALCVSPHYSFPVFKHVRYLT